MFVLITAQTTHFWRSRDSTSSDVVWTNWVKILHTAYACQGGQVRQLSGDLPGTWGWSVPLRTWPRISTRLSIVLEQLHLLQVDRVGHSPGSENTLEWVEKSGYIYIDKYIWTCHLSVSSVHPLISLIKCNGGLMKFPLDRVNDE